MSTQLRLTFNALIVSGILWILQSLGSPAYALQFDFTPEALKTIAFNEVKRTRLCVVNDVRQVKLEERRKRLIANQEESRSLGRTDFANNLESDLAKLESELASVDRDFFRCDGALLLGSEVARLCKRLGWDNGGLCPSLAQARAENKSMPILADSMEKLVTGQVEQDWKLTAPESDLPAATAAVRRGNLQVIFRIGTEPFSLENSDKALARDLEKQFREVNRSHKLRLEDKETMYVPFLSAEVTGANGYAGEIYQTLVGIKNENGYIPLGPALEVSLGARSTLHNVPLNAQAWAELSLFQTIGVVGSKRSGEKDQFLYFFGIETAGLQSLLDQLMAHLRERQSTL